MEQEIKALDGENYLSKDELEALNLIVSFYLDFAELQARSRRPMHMAEWIAKLDDFLRLSERQILTHAGKVSHEAARARAEAEYDRYRAIEDAKPSEVDRHFEEAVRKLKRLEHTPPASRAAGKERTKPARRKKANSTNPKGSKPLAGG